jgi:hypothetical protein
MLYPLSFGRTCWEIVGRSVCARNRWDDLVAAAAALGNVGRMAEWSGIGSERTRQ